MDGLRWTPHLEESLCVLDESHECLNDEILVQQVRLQLIAEKVAIGNWDDKASLSFYLQALHSQVQEVKSKLPPYLQSNEVLLAHVYSTELAINQIALSRLPIVHSYPDFEQLSYLCACTKSIKTWFEVFFSVSPTFYVGFPFSIFSQLRHCLATLHRLSTLDDPAWDKKGLRKIINLPSILDQVVNNLEQVATAAGLDNTASADGDVFSRTAKLLRSIRPVWEARLGPEDDVATALPPPQESLDISLFDPLPVDFTNNDWLTDLFLGPNY